MVIIFAKKPELGKVKTRIAEETSIEFAYEFSKTCFDDLINKVSNSDYYDLIIGSDSLDDLQWFQKNYSLGGIVVDYQRGVNKQEIQSNKFENIFSVLLGQGEYGYKKAILIPMDIPFILEEDLISAFARLDQKKFVFGPETNGGVYLIGLKTPFTKGVFDNIQWSTSNSFKDLVRNCGKRDTFSLKLKNDLNMPADILKLRDDIYHTCPILYKFLERHNYYFSIKDKYINFDDLSICIPVVSNLVQRNGKNGIEILLQTRYKHTVDLENTGKLEIPSGLIKRYELAQDAAIRETNEEASIISEISHDQAVMSYTALKNGDKVAIYRPFCCHQQLKGGRAYISLAFISNYVSGELKENFRENREPRWVPLNEIKAIIKKDPERIFGLSLVVLQEYLKYKKEL